MDYYLLTDLAVTMGYHLAMSGAETFRVEDTIHRILRAYGVECEVFAIPNCVSVSLEAANGKPLMLMRRIGFHGNDLEKLEKLNELSRCICAERPEVDTAMSWLEQTLAARRSYSAAAVYLGNLLVGLGFCLVFGGTLLDCLWAGLMGLIIGVVTRFMDKQEANPFFSTILASCLMALPAYAAAGLGWLNSPDAAIIGTLMILVPGLLITNSMRDIIYGDTNSGIFRIVQVLLTALAIALGTAAAWHLTAGLYGQPASAAVSWPAWAQAIAVFIGCCGFCILFNVHGRGMVLCVAGGVAAWMLYLLWRALGFDVYAANLFAAVFAALYAEVMARLRKCPATPYLVIATLPMLPGAGVYYTMSLGLDGEMMTAVGKGLETVGIAGSLAVGILLVCTVFRLINRRRGKAQDRKQGAGGAVPLPLLSARRPSGTPHVLWGERPVGDGVLDVPSARRSAFWWTDPRAGDTVTGSEWQGRGAGRCLTFLYGFCKVRN